MKEIIVGTRGSQLALAQMHQAMQAVVAANAPTPLQYSVQTIQTSGDDGKEAVGAFVKEVEYALLKGEVDVAVHSLKDMPTEIVAGLTIASYPLRASVADLLLTKSGLTLMELPQGATVGTGSPRREFQLRSIRPDLQILPIKGNIQTRMRYVEDGRLDAVILAKAGIERMDADIPLLAYELTLDEMLPAVAQGILGLQCRTSDEDNTAMLRALNDPDTELCAIAERAFLQATGGGCRKPMAALATIDGPNMSLRGLLYTEDGQKVVKHTLEGNKLSADELGTSLGTMLREALLVA